MKILIVLLLLVAFISARNYLINDQEIISKINSDPERTWTAGVNKVFEGKTLRDVKKMLGSFLIQKDDENRGYGLNIPQDFAPDAFDSREQWPTCIHKVENQGQCGSCWAVSLASVMSDRWCIHTKGEVNTDLSSQDLVSCDKYDAGCQGGYRDKPWQYCAESGIVTEACFPYASSSGSSPACPFTNSTNVCPKKGVEYKKYYCRADYVQFTNIETAMDNVMTYGPIKASFKVYQDFFNYKSGVYQHKTGSFAGGHATRLVGWGVDASSKLPYWIVANSWGAEWGLKGYFWILKGKNECEIESGLWTGYVKDF